MSTAKPKSAVKSVAAPKAAKTTDVEVTLETLSAAVGKLPTTRVTNKLEKLLTRSLWALESLAKVQDLDVSEAAYVAHLAALKEAKGTQPAPGLALYQERKNLVKAEWEEAGKEFTNAELNAECTRRKNENLDPWVAKDEGEEPAVKPKSAAKPAVKPKSAAKPAKAAEAAPAPAKKAGGAKKPTS
jgi:hypothetical protein